ncbi:nitrilotriacetate monooxygenase component A [Amycolatopsis mediterranei S699]|uniref:Nitrilotriacetate monooxygenase component A n=2 Tax=Amycolatopsis mediterranei TaxID=33910 RepID=A0A0H3CWH2_AMYMU|nr:NtaA/DmoA family FMN-dependent monooxygenase [Amycolatopsis mediterranei]ADJ42395.1 nitrilotriacetate monooxygenase component A [Amycolatopsis mediterranei U32]AEK39081.1 nitrilotriacetate monooxygenase component A [Amycolatopsis mediterranei S699]AFO74110.1 nitrilotriacetate monooxygenase component A [Amycolatopsis mediterranei S699]AGT81239.1 nitrilotriacetate monooxygenase component A [Amycolatopsis mediterranei RB]KDO09696.1 F420-dependent methylene-tetrahydromethanopterin reductase [Am
MTKQIKLAAHFPGVNNTTVWSDPASGSQIDFASFEHLARTAERGKFDFLFLAEGLRLREHAGKILDSDVVGRPNTTTVLAALSAVTTHLGLAGTLSSTFNEPYEVARQVASIDHLSGGRAAWNVVTSPDAFTGQNFRRGGFLKREDRYARAEEFLATVRELWDSWAPGTLVGDKENGVFARDPGRFVHSGPQFDIAGEFTLPRTPQGQPIVIQAGDSDEGREFAAKTADVIFSRHGTLEDGQAFYHDVKRRLAAYGRDHGELLIMPAATFVLGDTDAEAEENAREIRLQQVRPATAIQFLEQVWSRDLSDYDVDGPLPEVDPDPDAEPLTWGRVRHEKDPLETARRWRAVAEEKKLSIRELVIEATARQQFVGTPSTVAATIDEYVQSDAADGFVLVPHLTPGGLDEFVEKVVPHLQERGVFRTEYAGPTLREQLF